MNVLTIAYYSALKYLRSIPIIVGFVFLTIVIIFLTTSGGMESYNQLDSSYREKVGYFRDDKGTAAGRFDSFINSPEVKKVISLKKVKTYNDGIRQIKNGDIESFIYIGNGFSKKVESGKKADLSVFSANKVSVARTLAEGFVNSNNSAVAVADIGNKPGAGTTFPNLDSKGVETKGKVPGQRDAASVSDLITMMFYGALFSSYLLINDSNKRTILRFKTAPVKYWENMTGKMLGVVSVITVFEAVIILITKLVFNVNWGGNPAVILLALILFSVIISSFGIIIASISKNIFICGLITFAFNMFLVYAVQTQAYAPGSSSAFDVARLVSPHYYAYQAIIGSIYSGTSANVPVSLLILAVVAAVLAAISMVVGRRRTV